MRKITLFVLVIALLSFCKKDDEKANPNSAPVPTTVKDADGNNYNVITIGNQHWLKENLKTTKFNDGTPIPNITGQDDWKALTSPAYCWYDNDINHKSVYGALYNWFAVNTGKLCPSGWHVPTDLEWGALITYLGGDSIAGGKLKETGTTHWMSPNTSATNESGFTALPGGDRTHNGHFMTGIGYAAYFWSSTEYFEYNYTVAWNRGISFQLGSVSRSHLLKKYGLAIRCTRN